MDNGRDMRKISNIILQQKERRILRMPEVERRTGYKKAHIYNLMREGKFPQSIKLGIRSVGWDSFAIEQWIEERINKGGMPDTSPPNATDCSTWVKKSKGFAVKR